MTPFGIVYTNAFVTVYLQSGTWVYVSVLASMIYILLNVL